MYKAPAAPRSPGIVRERCLFTIGWFHHKYILFVLFICLSVYLFDMYMGEQLERFSLSKCIQKRNDFCPQTKMVRRSLWGDRYVRSGLPPHPRPVWGKDLDKTGKGMKNKNKRLFTIYKCLCVSKWTRDINRVEVFVRPLFWCFPGASQPSLAKSLYSQYWISFPPVTSIKLGAGRIFWINSSRISQQSQAEEIQKPGS